MNAVSVTLQAHVIEHCYAFVINMDAVSLIHKKNNNIHAYISDNRISSRSAPLVKNKVFSLVQPACTDCCVIFMALLYIFCLQRLSFGTDAGF